jgi:hypothetical protein
MQRATQTSHQAAVPAETPLIMLIGGAIILLRPLVAAGTPF